MTKDPADLEFVDAVFSIPKNAYKITLEVLTFEDGESSKAVAEFGPADIREALDLFQQTVDGEYPLYTVTDEGREYVEKLMNK